MSETLEGRVARVEARQGVQENEQRNHAIRDDDRFNTVVRDVSDIKEMIRGFGQELQKGFTRVHERIDDEAGKARHNLANAVGNVNGAMTLLRKETTEQVEEVAKDVAKTNGRISTQAITGLAALVGVLVTIAGFFIAMQIRPPAPVSAVSASQQGE